MRPPEELDGVDWAVLVHGYGCAEDVPELIRTMHSPDDVLSADAEEELSVNLLVDDTLHSATAPVVPFLVHAVRSLPARREALLQTLVDLAHTGSRTHPLAGVVRMALEEAMPDLLPALNDPAPAVRRTAVRLAALVGSVVVGAAVPLLHALYQRDPIPEIRADALTALARVDPDPESVLARETEALTDRAPTVRVAAALLRLERAELPYPDDSVEVLADDGGDDTDEEDRYFPPLGTRRQRLNTVLRTDPDAALIAATHWIAQGDRFSHGSRLADQVARSWRDRETEVVDTLATALPHHRDSSSLRALLLDLACWIPDPAGCPGAPGRPGVAADLRETLLSYTDHRNLAVRQAALVGLARCGDDRALDRATAPDLLALVSFSRDPRALPHLRTALRISDRRHNPEHLHVCRVLEALSPDLSARLVPEIAGLLDLPYPLVPAAKLLGDLGPQVSAHPDILPQLIAAMEKLRHLGQRAALAVAHVRLTGGFDGCTLKLLKAAVSYPHQAADAWDAVGLLGPVAEPLLPQIEEARGPEQQPGVRLAAAAARWRITGDPGPEIPIIAACVQANQPPRHGLRLRLRAVQELAVIGTAPQPLYPLLQHFAASKRRLIDGSGPLPWAEMDEQLRCAARQLMDAAAH